MYYPYFRGKQFELVLLREQASLIAESKINPIIEFVKDNAASMRRVLTALVENRASFTIIINPIWGELAGQQEQILDRISEMVPLDYDLMSLGYIVNTHSNRERVRETLQSCGRHNVSIIHYGFPDGQIIAQETRRFDNIRTHVFIDSYTSKLYQRHFPKEGVDRVLIRDGFRRQRNEDYPPNEHFSDLHITFEDEGVNSFGDFLIVGDEFREQGGPAHAVAIHLTYLNFENDMYIMHFISDRTGSPVDPAGKFLEALEKLVRQVRSTGTHIFHSNACEEYEGLFEASRFPGLGYVKKLSMQHHLELMADFLD